MNKIFTGLFILAVSFSANAADKMGMRSGSLGVSGCGLGSMIWEKNTKTHQILSGTTNGLFGTQTFGISSETSNCAGTSSAQNENAQRVFVSMNYESLMQEMAKGSGDTLAAFSQVLGCKSSNRFNTATQNKYNSVFSKTDSPEELLGSVKSEISTDASYASACNG